MNEHLFYFPIDLVLLKNNYDGIWAVSYLSTYSVDHAEHDCTIYGVNRIIYVYFIIFQNTLCFLRQTSKATKVRNVYIKTYILIKFEN